MGRRRRGGNHSPQKKSIQDWEIKKMDNQFLTPTKQ
jgi:hypothetical protein